VAGENAFPIITKESDNVEENYYMTQIADIPVTQAPDEVEDDISNLVSSGSTNANLLSKQQMEQLKQQEQQQKQQHEQQQKQSTSCYTLQCPQQQQGTLPPCAHCLKPLVSWKYLQRGPPYYHQPCFSWLEEREKEKQRITNLMKKNKNQNLNWNRN
jgi:hypothetical protein